MIAEGEAVLETALRHPGGPDRISCMRRSRPVTRPRPPPGRPTGARSPLLYGELIRYEPTPVVEANRAVAVAMAEGPAAGLVILDALAPHPQLQRWAQLHIARAELLRRLGHYDEAANAYRAALDLAGPGRPVVHRQAPAGNPECSRVMVQTREQQRRLPGGTGPGICRRAGEGQTRHVRR